MAQTIQLGKEQAQYPNANTLLRNNYKNSFTIHPF